jgi:stage IV sporulation protein A
MAAEVGTQKVIAEHSTIGLVITTDGSITEIPREEYAEAEERVIRELQELGKPFAVLLNTVDPNGEQSQTLCAQLSEKYGVPVRPVNCLEIGETDICGILETILFEFPVREIGFRLPTWVMELDHVHPVRRSIMDSIKTSVDGVEKIRELNLLQQGMDGCEYVSSTTLSDIQLGQGSGVVQLAVKPDLFYRVLGETTGIPVSDEGDLMRCMTELSSIRKKYDKIKAALEQVENTGYGIVMPTAEQMELEPPELIRKSGSYGVKLRAGAPSIHMIRVDIDTEISPMVGDEKQSRDLVEFLQGENPDQLWQSNIFGKSVYTLIQDGLSSKLLRTPEDVRTKFRGTLSRVVNEGASGLICLIL